jgi:hypothetical protein
MKHKCRICGNEYDYCHSCAITKNVFKNAGYCGENCYHISMILQRYNGRVMTAIEAMRELKQHDIDNISLRPSVERHYNNIVDEINAQVIEEVVPQEDVEVVINENEDMTIS